MKNCDYGYETSDLFSKSKIIKRGLERAKMARSAKQRNFERRKAALLSDIERDRQKKEAETHLWQAMFHGSMSR